MHTRHQYGREYYHWAVSPDSDLFIELQPDGLIELGDEYSDRNTITPEELLDLYRTIGEVIQFIQDNKLL